MRVIYARPANLPDRFTTMAPIVRTLVQMANGLLNEEAQSVGGAALYQVRCDTSLPNFPANGFVAVDHVVLPTNSNADSFSTIVTDLQRLGFSSFFEKYWIYYDDHVGDFGGQGSFHDDDRLVIDNANNHGPDYAITYGYESMQIMMHENAHTLGAVQASAPHSSGAAHCNDGQDIMCYADGGPKSNYNPGVCLVNDAVGLVRQNFDCGHNDYFHPNPPAGSYLATHWNLGSGLNRFIAASKFPN